MIVSPPRSKQQREKGRKVFVAALSDLLETPKKEIDKLLTEFLDARKGQKLGDKKACLYYNALKEFSDPGSKYYSYGKIFCGDHEVRVDPDINHYNPIHGENFFKDYKVNEGDIFNFPDSCHFNIAVNHYTSVSADNNRPRGSLFGIQLGIQPREMILIIEEMQVLLDFIYHKTED